MRHVERNVHALIRHDYWIWLRLDACSPRIVILEFNPAFGAKRAVTVQYDPAFDRACRAGRPEGATRAPGGGKTPLWNGEYT